MKTFSDQRQTKHCEPSQLACPINYGSDRPRRRMLLWLGSYAFLYQTYSPAVQFAILFPILVNGFMEDDTMRCTVCVDWYSLTPTKTHQAHAISNLGANPLQG